MRYRSSSLWAFGILYVAGMAGWIYGVLNPWPPEALLWASVVAVVIAHGVLGYYVRLWTLAFYAVAVVLAVPAGYPETGGEPLPLWITLGLFFAPVVLAATLIGLATRTLREKRGAW
jgi:hypothetical protein